MRKLPLGLIVLSLPMLYGCSPKTLMVRESPPQHLLDDCREPTLSDSTTGALVDLALDQRAALAECNADKMALRAWAHIEAGQ